MKTYSNYFPEEKESYDEYKERKFTYFKGKINTLLNDINSSSLKKKHKIELIKYIKSLNNLTLIKIKSTK